LQTVSAVSLQDVSLYCPLAQVEHVEQTEFDVALQAVLRYSFAEHEEQALQTVSDFPEQEETLYSDAEQVLHVPQTASALTEHSVVMYLFPVQDAHSWQTVLVVRVQALVWY
jgi:hypothetical protein